MYRSVTYSALLNNNPRINYSRGFVNIKNIKDDNESDYVNRTSKVNSKNNNKNKVSNLSYNHAYDSTFQHGGNVVEYKKFTQELESKFSKLEDAASKLKVNSKNSVLKKDDKTNEISANDDVRLYNAIENFSHEYNNAMEFLDSKSSKSKTIKSLENSFKNYMLKNKSQLSKIGINIDSENKLSISHNELADSIKNNKKSVLGLFSDYSSGIANAIYSSSQATINHSDDLFESQESNIRNMNRNSSYVYGKNNGLRSSALKGAYFSSMY